MCGCTHTVVRITAAVYEALRPILNEMREDISSMKSDIVKIKNEMATISQSVSNQTEEVNTRLSGLNESIIDDYSSVERELNSTANMVCDKIEEHDNQITTELMRMTQTLTDYIGGKCGGTWGWRHAVYLDMTDPNTNCPSGWNMTGYSKRICGRATDGYNTCDSVFFPVSGGPYSQVCGRIRAYQHGVPEAFWEYNNGRQTTIDSAYVSGMAVMYGSPRQHIWTFANGAWENDTRHQTWNCPCDTTGAISIPSFVGEDYFCEAGYLWPGYQNTTEWGRFHSNDILWDGRDCHSTSTCCSLHNPPYFTKTLSQTTTDDLELRICLYHPLYQFTYDNIAVELVELYVK